MLTYIHAYIAYNVVQLLENSETVFVASPDHAFDHLAL